jgi:hypothetical protein
MSPNVSTAQHIRENQLYKNGPIKSQNDIGYSSVIFGIKEEQKIESRIPDPNGLKFECTV